MLLFLLTTAIYKPLLDHIGIGHFFFVGGGPKFIAIMDGEPWPDGSLDPPLVSAAVTAETLAIDRFQVSY